MTEPEVTTNALPFEWLGLRQWARRVRDDAAAFAVDLPEATELLHAVGTAADAVMLLCADKETPRG